MEKIGIIGTGNMGRVIGLALAKEGYSVFFGARDLSKAKFAAELNLATQYGTNQQAAEFGDIIYFSPRDIHPKDILHDISSLDNKIIIESGNWNISNMLDADQITTSKTQILQQQIPNAKVVKAFNTITQEIFEHSKEDIKSHNVACFIASDYQEATNTIIAIASDLGFTGVDCGLSKQAVLLENAGSLIRILMRIQKTPWISFSLIELPIIKDLKFGGRTPSSLHTQLSYLKGK